MLLIHAFLTFLILCTSYYLRIRITIKRHFCFLYFKMSFHHSFIELDSKCSHSFFNNTAKFIDSSHEDYLHLSFLQTRTLSFIKKLTLTSASKNISQRVQTVISVSVSASSLSKQIKQSSLRTINVHNLFNFIKNENHANINSEFKFLLNSLRVQEFS